VDLGGKSVSVIAGSPPDIEWSGGVSQGRLPNLIIAGSVKSGTTSLFRYLQYHPQVCGSDVKETCFFLPRRYGRSCGDISEYRDHFRQCGAAKIVVESTPGYFDGGECVATEIKHHLEDVKIVILLRNPADRLLSFFDYQKAQLNLPANLGFEQYISEGQAIEISERRRQKYDRYWGVDGGRYINYLPAWVDVLGKENIYVMFFENLVGRPGSELAALCQWLQLDDFAIDESKLGVENRTVHYKFAWLQRLAISINKMTEPLARRAPVVKKVIRSAYYAINASQPSGEVTENDRSTAKGLYRSDNRALRDYLLKKGYSNLPRWLSDSDR